MGGRDVAEPYRPISCQPADRFDVVRVDEQNRQGAPGAQEQLIDPHERLALAEVAQDERRVGGCVGVRDGAPWAQEHLASPDARNPVATMAADRERFGR
jgi:hypothetical protein